MESDKRPDFTDRTWIFSQGGVTQKFRPADTANGEATEALHRGATTLEFGSDGTFLATGPGADDRSQMEKGVWHQDPQDPSRVRVRLNGQAEDTEYHLEVEENELRLRQP